MAGKTKPSLALEHVRGRSPSLGSPVVRPGSVPASPGTAARGLLALFSQDGDFRLSPSPDSANQSQQLSTLGTHVTSATAGWASVQGSALAASSNGMKQESVSDAMMDGKAASTAAAATANNTTTTTANNSSQSQKPKGPRGENVGRWSKHEHNIFFIVMDPYDRMA